MASLLGILALALTAQAGAVPPGATVEGVVRDAGSGQPLRGAVVALIDLDRAVQVGADGRYSFQAVPAGPQHLVVQHLGYRTRTPHLLVPGAGRLEFNVSLQPDPIALDAVRVRPTRPVRGLDLADSTAFPDRGISHAALRDHPTLAQADPLRALAGGEVLVEPESATGVHVRGGASDHTGFVLDGVPVLNPYHAAGLFSAWNPDALGDLAIAAAAPSPALPDALSGAIDAHTREPGPVLRMHSTLSNAEARVTVDGPAPGGASYLVSWRTGMTGALAPDEASYLAGETGDFVGTLRLPAFRGSLRLLLYDAENELAPASHVPAEGAGGEAPAPNRFAWASQSLGASWTRTLSPHVRLRLGGWRAGAESRSDWHAAEAPSSLQSSRTDVGFHAVVEHRSGRGASEAGIRGRGMTTSYRVRADASPGAWDAAGSTGVFTAFGQHGRRLGAGLDAWGGVSASLADGEIRLAPRARVRWRLQDRLVVTAAYSRLHQFAQSLRNTESVVGHVFPAELSLASGVGGVPVPRSDQVVLAVDLAALPGVRLGVQAFERRMEDLLLVAPVEAGPFASSAFATGAARARGASLEAAANGARYGLVASYGVQRVRVTWGDSAYTPRHGTTHTLDAGITVFPSPTSSLRLAVAAAAGRTGTAVSGPFEWETCNVLDQGCEFAGSPALAGPVGATPLPAYLRVDVGGRKHWHARVLGRELLFGVFGTLTNVLGRDNTLGYVVDAESGQRSRIEMLPRTPLVVGIDARF